MEKCLPEFVNNPNPKIFLKEDYGVLDFETTNLDKGDPINENNGIITACFGRQSESTGNFVYTVASGVGRGLERILREIEACSFIVSHNGKFELGWLRRLGVEISQILVWDTMLAEYVLRGNRDGWGGLALDECLRRRGFGHKEQLVNNLIKGGICPSQIPLKWLTNYCKRDVSQTQRLFISQRKELFLSHQERVFYTKCLQIPVLTDIEFNGMQLDKTKVQELYDKYHKELLEIDAELGKITGGINPRSHQQMAEFIFKTLGFDEPTDWRGNPIRTAGGKCSTSKEVIGKLTATNKSQRRFLELQKRHQKLDDACSKYLEKFKLCCDENSGLLHARINQTITKTGRYSSTGKRYKTQFQNFSREFKPLFTTRRSGWFIGEADESTLEFRAAVFFGQDNQGFKDVRERNDIHAYTASIIGCSRQDAKSHTFKPLYGGSSGTERERAYYRAFKEKYRGIIQWQDQLVQTALREKCITLPTGQKFWFPNVVYQRSGYINDHQKVRDYPVQYLATAEIVPIALIYSWYALRKAKTFIVNTVHDSIVCEVHPDETELFTKTLKYAMEVFPVLYMKKLYGIDFNVPLEAETKIGTHWGEK